MNGVDRASQKEDINEVFDHLKNTIIEAAHQKCPRNTKRQQYRRNLF